MERLRNDIPTIIVWGIIGIVLPIKFFYKNEEGFMKAVAVVWNADESIKKFIGFLLTVFFILCARFCYYKLMDNYFWITDRWWTFESPIGDELLNHQ